MPLNRIKQQPNFRIWQWKKWNINNLALIKFYVYYYRKLSYFFSLKKVFQEWVFIIATKQRGHFKIQQFLISDYMESIFFSFLHNEMTITHFWDLRQSLLKDSEFLFCGYFQYFFSAGNSRLEILGWFFLESHFEYFPKVKFLKPA